MSETSIRDFSQKLMSCISATPPSELDFNTFALELFDIQFRQVAPYRSFCQSRNATPGSVNHWTEIPSLPTAAFKEFDLTSLPPGERTTVFYSSGTTTSRRSRHHQGRDSLALYEASLTMGFSRFVTAPGASPRRMLVLTPPAAEAPHSSLVHMFDTLARESGREDSAFVGHVNDGGEWEVDFAQAIQWTESAAAQGRPLLILGTAFSFVHWVDHLNARGLRFPLPAGSLLMETGGYKGRSRELPKPELHRSLTTAFGVPADHILCEYGMSELCSQAYDTPHHDHSEGRRCFQFPDWARARVICSETGQEAAIGQPGLVEVLDLANTWSVACLRTEDLAVRHVDGFELLGRASQSEPRGCSLMTP